MPPKKDQKPLKGSKQVSTPLKDLLPLSIKQPIRDPRPIRLPEPHALDKKTEYRAFQQPPDWPGDEQAKAFDYGLEIPSKFNDPFKLKVPESFSLTSSQITFWRRPKEFILDEIEIKEEVDTEIANFRRGSSNPLEKPLIKSKFRSMATGNFGGTEELKIEDDIRIHSPKKRNKDIGLQIKVFGIIERLETEEEFEKRKKELEEKKLNTKEKKKNIKKEEPIEDSPILMKEIKLSNIDMSGYYPYFSKWLASQFQIIKDRNLRDVFTDKPIWSKIYPQQDNMPVYNKSGRYWVKLYYMGRERKIEIDDKMPTSVKNHCLFPRSVKQDEIWPMLLAKAIMKLNSYTEGISSNSQDMEFGDGGVIYSLTGLIPETLHIPKMMMPDDWKYVGELLKDYHYLNNTAYVTCYCSSYYKPFAPSNRMINEKEAMVQAITFERKLNPEEDIENEPVIKPLSTVHKDSIKSPVTGTEGKFKRFSPKKNKTTIELPLHVSTGKSTLSKDKPTYVIPGFGYSIMEAFYTDGFNMVYVQQHSEKVVRLIQEYLELNKIYSHKMMKDEKIEIRRKRKELKEKINEDEKKRKELIEKPPNLYRFFRVKTAIAKVPVLNIMNPFSGDEIFLAKKCVINKLKNPPNYDLPEIKATADDKSVYSNQVSVAQTDNQMIKPLEDFSSLPNIKEPMKRGVGGTWILDKDFNACYEYLQIFYNPNKLLHYKHINFMQNENFELTNNEACEVVIIEETLEILDQNSLFPGNKVPFIMSFAPSKASNAVITPNPYCILQKFDFQSFESVKNYKTLNQSIDSLHLLLENKNHVFRIVVNNPLGYSLWFACYNNFKHMSISEYLIKYEGFTNKCYNTEYMAIEKERYHVFFKYRFKDIEKSQNLIVRIKMASEPYIIKYMRYKLIQLKTSTELESNEYSSEGIIYTPDENSQEVLDYNKFSIKSNNTYILLLESRGPFTLPEGTMELEVLYKYPLNIDVIENLEPVEYTDRYTVNKYGILFRERLFLHEDSQVSIHLRLISLAIKEAIINAKEPRSNKKPLNNQNDSDNNETEVTDKRLLLFELYENNTLLYANQGLNSAVFSNLWLKGNKDETLNRNYYLQAKFDLREWPGCTELTEDTKTLAWVIKVYYNEPVAFLKDTQKEDSEKAIRKAWEDKESGRAEKAKKSRYKYMLLQKKQEGEALTEQENEVLNEMRVTKKQRDEELLKQAAMKSKSPMKERKQPVNVKGGKKEEPVVEEKKERILPKSSQHRLLDINDFLGLMEGERILEEKPLHGGLIETRNNENKRELNEGFIIGKEAYMSELCRIHEDNNQIKALQGELKKNFIERVDKRKKEVMENINGIVKERDDIKKGLCIRRDKEKALLDICNGEKVNAEELEKHINEVSNVKDFEGELIKYAKKVLNNAKIINVMDKLQGFVNIYDLNGIQNCIEEIGKVNMIIEEDLLDKANEIIEEAKNNPNYITEKQAELKKTAKKPGKK